MPFAKGHKLNRGKVFSVEHRQRLSLAKLGKKYPKMSEGSKKLWSNEDYRKKQIKAHKGQTPINLKELIAYRKSEEGRKMISERLKGRTSWNRGKKMPQISGENHYLWKKGRNSIIEKHRLRGTKEWASWRSDVFERDNYRCQECRVTRVYLEPHHIIPIRSDMDKIFKINNGITLCRPCHRKTMGKESSFAEKYSALVAA